MSKDVDALRCQDQVVKFLPQGLVQSLPTEVKVF